MKKFVMCLVSLCLLPLWLASEGFDVAARAGYFLPLSDNARNIYMDGWAEYEIEARYTLSCPWGVWANVGYTHVNGHSHILHNHTRLTMVPISAGFRYVWQLQRNYEAYLGLGGSCSILRIHDESPYVHEHIHKIAYGVTAKSGLIYHFACWGFFEGFIDYNYTRFNFSGHRDNIYRNDLDMSSFLFGGSIGITF